MSFRKTHGSESAKALNRLEDGCLYCVLFMKRFVIGFFTFGLLLALVASLHPGAQSIWWDWQGLNSQDMVLKVAVAAVLAWWLPAQRDRVNYWSFNFLVGLLIGSIGLFPIRAIHFAGMARWPFLFLGAAIPDLGSVFWNTTQLSPLFASCVIPLCLLAFLISHDTLKWLVLGISVGVTGFMIVAAFSSPTVIWFSSDFWSMTFLLVNAVVCAISTRLFFSVATGD